MTKNNQKVSIILPIYNAEASLAQCLDSLLTQTYADIEVIAIDDYSKDRSLSLLKLYQKLDKRIRIFQNVKHYGKSVTLNRGLKHISGRFILFMNQSDTCTKDKIRKQVQYLIEQPKTVAVGTQCLYLNEQHKRIGKSYFPTDSMLISKTIFTGFAVHNESVLINRFMLPSDLLHFSPALDKQFSYTPVLIKLLKYGTIANLDQQLHNHVKNQAVFYSLHAEWANYIKLWFQARFVYDLRLPLQTLFYPLVR